MAALSQHDHSNYSCVFTSQAKGVFSGKPKNLKKVQTCTCSYSTLKYTVVYSSSFPTVNFKRLGSFHSYTGNGPQKELCHRSACAGHCADSLYTVCVTIKQCPGI